MYNGIGLTTARGSGTSGYVQKNLSHIKPFAQQKQRDSFIKELQALKDNVLAPPKKANKEILLHQQKRDIQLQLVKMRDKLEQDGLTPEEIDERVNKAEKILNDKLANGELELASAMDYHKKALEKEKEYERVRQAFRMSEDYKPGSAFDFEAQEKKRLEQLYEKEKQKYEQKKIEKKMEKEKLKAQESAPQAIEAEGDPQASGREGRGEQKKPQEDNVKRTNKEVRERAAERRGSPFKRREPTKRRDRSDSREASRRDKEGRSRGDDRDKERTRRSSTSKDRAKRSNNSKEKSRLKDRSRSRSHSKEKRTKEVEKPKRREDSREKNKNRRKDSSSSERSRKSDKSEKKTRRRHDSSSSSSRSRSASSSSSRSSSSSKSD